ncbi:response regulator transcription factor [Sulfurimonas sp.]|uniref:response regulator transcription factor n=1 Tax=Sulfurimonas sp. TaxID=2022749 RepID=UPI00356536D0
MQENILIVDDDSDILELLEYNLSNAGYDVIGCLNTKNVRRVLQEEDIDLIIMDRNLPDIEGSTYIEMLRSKNINIPVIFLSAKDNQEDINEGFLKGGDDYITKPFNIDELQLRIKAVLKRYKINTKETQKELVYKDIKLDLNLHKARIGEYEINLTKLEITLMHILIINKGKVLDRDFLINNIWKDKKTMNKKTVTVAMKRLKEKIDPFKNKNYIKTIRGVGYLLN